MALLSKKIFTLATNACRFVLALVLAVSGFVKAVDPIGAMYKMKEYMVLFSVDAPSEDWAMFFAVVQAALEFLLGVFLLTGVYRKFVSAAAPLLMMFFTLLTLFIYANSSVDDCGCFGEAVTLTNGETFAKNVALLLLSLVVFLGRKRFVYNVSSRCRWMVTIYSIFYIAIVQIMSFSHLPVIDFSRYAIGTDLRRLAQGTPDEYMVYYTYERNGETMELPENEVPDSTWTCVSSRAEVVKQGEKPIVGDFSIVDWEEDYDATEEMLADTGYVCFIVIERLETASVSRVDKINDLYDYCLENDIPFYAATASDNDEIELWRKRTGAEYPLYWSDEALLGRIIRANPGMLLLKNGVIAGKWNVADLPSIETFAASPVKVVEKSDTAVEYMKGWTFWILALVLPIIFFCLVDLFVCRATAREIPQDAPAGKDENEQVCPSGSKEAEADSSGANTVDDGADNVNA